MVDREIGEHVDVLPEVRAAGHPAAAGRQRRTRKVGLADGTGSRESRTRGDQGPTRVPVQGRQTGASVQVSISF